jgi:hypothetical protein
MFVFHILSIHGEKKLQNLFWKIDSKIHVQTCTTLQEMFSNAKAIDAGDGCTLIYFVQYNSIFLKMTQMSNVPS